MHLKERMFALEEKNNLSNELASTKKKLEEDRAELIASLKPKVGGRPRPACLARRVARTARSPIAILAEIRCCTRGARRDDTEQLLDPDELHGLG